MVLVSGSTKMPRLTALGISVRVVRGAGKPRNTPTTRPKATRKNPEGICTAGFSPLQRPNGRKHWKFSMRAGGRELERRERRAQGAPGRRCGWGGFS